MSTLTAARVLPPDPTIQEELSTLDDEAIFEMTNLPPRRTGIAGIIWLSTEMSSHGPLVKYFCKTGKGQPSFSVSIAEQPKVLASSVPDTVLREAAPDVIEWVGINRRALLRFWSEAETWTSDEVIAFIDGLKKLSK